MRTGTCFGGLRTQHANESVAVCDVMLSVKLQYFAVLSPSRRLMQQRKRMKEMLLETISKCEFLSLK